MTHPDSFGARSTLSAGGSDHEIFRLDALQSRYDVARLPYTLRILLENLLRREDGDTVTARRRRGRRDVGRDAPSRRARSRSRRRASCCRTSPACPPSSTSPRCATRWPRSAATRAGSTR